MWNETSGIRSTNNTRNIPETLWKSFLNTSNLKSNVVNDALDSTANKLNSILNNFNLNPINLNNAYLNTVNLNCTKLPPCKFSGHAAGLGAWYVCNFVEVFCSGG